MNSYEIAEKLSGDTDKDIELLTSMMLSERDRETKRTIIELLDRVNDYAHLTERGLTPSGVRYFDFVVGDCLFEMPSDDVIDALSAAKKGAENGDAEAQYTYAMYILGGALGYPDYTAVVDLLKKSAEQGNSGALYELGVCYMNGEGVRNDSLETERLWKRAVELGNVDAMVALGAAYRGGKGLPENPKGCFEMYKAAADAGSSAGYLHLGICYFNGTGTEADIEKAIATVQIAEDMGNSDAKMLLKRMQRYYEEEDLDELEIAARNREKISD
ncbi:MAG: sel1 repeat family protein [Clostridia bacterium]|nr:sel1 repeat family protein [Clostridia bacterium]